MTTNKINQIIRNGYRDKLPLRTIAAKAGISIEAVKGRAYRNGFSNQSNQSKGSRTRRATTQREEEKKEDRIKELETHLEAVKKLRESKSTYEIKPSNGRNSEATAIACFSDVHIGERVTLAQTNGKNEYSIPIARARCARFFERVVRLTEKERQAIRIDNLILFIGGDIIDGALHMDTIQANEVSEPMKQAIIAQEIIESGLLYLKKHGKFKKITIVCKDGNHGRVSAKLHAASRAGNALEWFMYYNLAARYPEFNWIVEEGLHTYVKVYDYTIRFHHGDSIHPGGMNGPYTYINRRVLQWNQSIRADLDVFGHLHMLLNGPNFVLNGSIVGYNAYAIMCGFREEPPKQAYFLIDKKRFKTVDIPIFCNA